MALPEPKPTLTQVALHEALRCAHQQSDDPCLAYTLLWLAQARNHTPTNAPPAAHDGSLCTRVAQAYDGAAATAGEGGAASVQQQQAVLRRCLARAHELRLPELAALASLARHILHLLC